MSETQPVNPTNFGVNILDEDNLLELPEKQQLIVYAAIQIKKGSGLIIPKGSQLVVLKGAK